jgi:hypothetical protein
MLMVPRGVVVGQDLLISTRCINVICQRLEMGNKKLLRHVLVFGVAVLCMASCAERDDVRAIRTLIKEGAVLAEKHDIGGILALASEDLQALPGELDRQQVRGVLWRAFKYYGALKVIYPRPAVDVEKDNDHALARFPFLIVKREHSLPKLEALYNDPQGWLDEVGENADLYRLKLALIKKGGGWLVREVHLEQFTGLGFRE